MNISFSKVNETIYLSIQKTVIVLLYTPRENNDFQTLYNTIHVHVNLLCYFLNFQEFINFKWYNIPWVPLHHSGQWCSTKG